MVRLEDGRYIIGFDDGYQLGKTASHVFDNGIHRLGTTEPTLKENSLFYDGEYFKVGEGRAALRRIRFRMMTQGSVPLRLSPWNSGVQGSTRQRWCLRLACPFQIMAGTR